MANKDNNWEIFIDFQGGLAPMYFKNTWATYGNKNQFNSMNAIDLTDPNVIKQGPRMVALTEGGVGETVSQLIKGILRVPLKDASCFAIGGNHLYNFTSGAVSTQDPYPYTIDNGGSEAGEDVVLWRGKLYGFYNNASGGDILEYDLDPDSGLFYEIDVDWGCYSDDTEVLTYNGWKLIKDVKKGEKIYSYNPENGNVEIAVNNETINKSYNGKMISFKNEGIDLLTTPDHKMLAGFRKYNNKKTHLDYQIVRADSLLDKTNFHLSKNANWKGKIIENWEIPFCLYKTKTEITKRDKKGKITECKFKNKEIKSVKIPIKLFLEFLGFYISEGHCSSNGKQIGISQSKEKNFYTWKIIKKCLDNLGFSYSEHKRGDGFTICNKQLCQYIKNFVKGKSYEKYIPKEILELDKSLLIYFYDALMLGDGYLKTNQYYTSSPKLRDDFVELVNRLGWSAKIWKRDNRGKKILDGRIVKHIQFVIGITKQKNEQIFNTDKERKRACVKTEKYEGNIVCLVLDKNHIMLVRRNNKQVWCGNSTYPSGAVALEDAPHQAINGGDDDLYFSNGPYVGRIYYDDASPYIETTSLDFWKDGQVSSLSWNWNRVIVAYNRPNTTGATANQSAIYNWDGVSPSWEGDPIEVNGRIGALYTKNGTTFVWWQESGQSNRYNLGYIGGSSLKKIKQFSGTLPLYYQVGEFQGFIAWLPNDTNLSTTTGGIILYGPLDDEIAVKSFKYCNPAGLTSRGGIGTPFGELVAASRLVASYLLEKPSGYSNSATGKTIAFKVSGVGFKSQIDLIQAEVDPISEGGRCNVYLYTDKGNSSLTLDVISVLDSSPTIYKLKDVYPQAEDFQLEIDYSESSPDVKLSIRSIAIKGHNIDNN